LNEYKLLAYVAKEIVGQRDSYEAAVKSGGVKDFAEYKNLCGLIQGLTHAEAIINDLVQRMEKSDD
jgi:hypothetical protein